MRLDWSPLALEDRLRIFDYIVRDDPGAAVAIDERIRDHVSHLAAYPELGRPGGVAGTRELAVVGTPYLVAYRIKGGEVVGILRILHGAQRWPDNLGEV